MARAAESPLEFLILSRNVWLARIAITGFGTWFALLFALHLLEPNYSHVEQMLSEYALSEHGYLMQAAFLALAIGFVALAAGMYGAIRPVPRLFSALLAISGVMAVLAMFFESDGNTLGPPETLTGYLHVASVVVGIVPLGAAAVMLPAAFRGDPRWRDVGAFALGWGVLIVVATVLHFATYWTNWRGLFQRIDMLIITGWLLFVALRLEVAARYAADDEIPVNQGRSPHDRIDKSLNSP